MEKIHYIERRRIERRRNIQSARRYVGMERRTGDRRTGQARRHQPGLRSAREGILAR